MRVVVNTGGGYVIPPEVDEQKIGQPWEQPSQRGRRNVRARGERGWQQQPPQPIEGGVPTNPFQSRVGIYLDNLCGVLIITMKQSIFYLHTLMLSDRRPCHLITRIFRHRRSYGQGKEMELGQVEHERTKMINDIYPFILVVYFLSLSFVCFVLVFFFFIWYV